MDMDEQAMGLIVRQLMAMSLRLKSKVPPGHCDYISKDAAGDWCQTLAENITSLKKSPVAQWRERHSV